ncbi:K02A2.6-like, partial [Cordylochernes scorpioides]
MAQIQPPETFDFSTPNEWPKWRKRFERYLVVSGMKKKEEADKIDLFMYLMGDRADDIFRTFKFEKEEEATKIDSVLKAFDNHFCVRKNIIYERAKFNSRIQEDREPVDEFITSLYKLADSCEFEGLHEQLIRDRIVVGVRDKALSERMQLDSELTLEKAVKMVRQQEAVRQQQVDLQRPSTSQKVNQVKFNSKKQSPKQQQQPSRKKEKSAKTRSRCPKCGGFTHREGQACRAEGQKCNLCSKTGHFANCCPDKQAKTAEVKAVSELDEEIGFLLEVSAVEDSSNLDDDEGECRRRWTAEIQVNGKKVKFKLDSQADVTCVPLCLFKKIMGQQRLVESDINIRAAEFSELQTVGMFISTLRNGNYEIKEKIYVIRRLSEPLLSRRACELLNLARRIEVVATRINPIKEFPEVFEGLGQIGNPYEIKLKPGAKPYAVHTPRRVPIPLMEKLKTRLEELEKAGIIAQVIVATEWCAPTVIAGKPNGDIRLCVDLSRLNEHVQREVHPMPVVEHMLGQLGEARFFSKLDANSGFHQIPLSPDCQHLTTFITPFGRYKYCRMPFGISLAPEHFQRIMSIILQGMDGVMCYLDDILIFASDSKTHDRILRLVLRKLKEAKVTLNKAKCVFGVPRINFLGHILDEDGIRPDPAKIEAVAKMPAPTDVHGVRKFLGMVNHLGRKLRTTLPIAPENLNPKLVDSQTLKRKEGRRRKDMKSRYDRRCGATDMEELSEGDTVWITDMRTWGIVKKKASTPRSYMVDTPVGTLRRNRFHLRKGVTVQYPADPSTPTFSGEELVENEKTPVVDYPSNDSEDGQIRTRSGRIVKPNVNGAIKEKLTSNYRLRVVTTTGRRHNNWRRVCVNRFKCSFTGGGRQKYKADAKPTEDDDVTLDRVFSMAVSFELAEQNAKELQDGLVAKMDIVPGGNRKNEARRGWQHGPENEIDGMVNEGILQPIEYANWAAPIVPVLKKDGSLRICGDFRCTANKAIELDKYPLPSIDEIFSKLSGNTVFSSSDLSRAYLQVRLSEEAKRVVNINTTKGLFAFKRLPYGVAVAPNKFQREMDNLFADMSGVACYIDDILVAGKDHRDHEQKLELVFKRLQEKGLRLNKDKCKFAVNAVEYSGFKIDKKGLHPISSKIEAVVEAPEPTNVSQLRSFIGLLMYYSRFIRNIADILAPFYHLLKKNSKWNWTGEHRILFAKCKALLTNESVLAHYDATRELVLACDASSYGLGVVLSHRNDRKEETPIAFASRTLTEAERRYSQLEKEALSIIFGCEKFRQYLLGREFVLITDNRPLMHIFSPQKPIPICAASRIKRWSLKLSAFKYTVEFRKTDDNGNADALSRLPLVSKTTESLDEDQVLLLRKMSEVPFSFQDVAVETRRDKLLSIVLRNVRENNWQIPKVSQENPLCSYYRIKDELSCEFGCLQWRERVVIPQKLRSSILNDLHEMHLGMVKMKMIARRYFWWPGIDKNIEELARDCRICQESASMPPSTISEWTWPEKPWHRLHLDLAGPFMGRMFMVLVDAYTKWLEIIIKDITSRTIIGHLREIFARFGLPELLVTDNGRQFVSSEFEEFTKINGIRHTKTSPYNPSTNGLAERYVREFKNSLRKNQGKDSVEINLQRFLFAHRAFPQTVLKESPAELLMKINLRSRFSNLIPKMAKVGEVYHDAMRKQKHFAVGSEVYFRNFANGPKWKRGRIMELLSSRHYLIEDEGRYVKRHINQLRPVIKKEVPEVRDLVLPGTSRDFILPGTSRDHPGLGEQEKTREEAPEVDEELKGAESSAQEDTPEPEPGPAAAAVPVPVRSPRPQRSRRPPEPEPGPARSEMPPKKRKPIGKVLPEVSKKRNVRSAETAVQREHRLRINRERASTSRAAESVGQRENRLQQDRDRASTSRAAESVGQRENRLRQNRNRVSTSRAAETPQEHTARILNVRERTLASRNSRDRLSNLLLEGRSGADPVPWNSVYFSTSGGSVFCWDDVEGSAPDTMGLVAVGCSAVILSESAKKNAIGFQLLLSSCWRTDPTARSEASVQSEIGSSVS